MYSVEFLYIFLYIRPLSDIRFANIFSILQGCHLTTKVLILMKSNLSFFLFSLMLLVS